MRASTVRCRVLDRCGDSLGVEISFKDVCLACRKFLYFAEMVFFTGRQLASLVQGE